MCVSLYFLIRDGSSCGAPRVSLQAELFHEKLRPGAAHRAPFAARGRRLHGTGDGATDLTEGRRDGLRNPHPSATFDWRVRLERTGAFGDHINIKS